ncbi:MAG: hypothetical protein FWC62_00565 [Firmicutes bacterium]|nr:hypothetical protein [Bacillota bacterium]
MRKRFVFIVLILCIACSCAVMARAADLPINMDALKNQQYAGDAVTPRFNIDLFSEKASSLTEAITAYQQRQQEETAGGLFAGPHELAPVDVETQIASAASGVSLFAAPDTHSGVTAARNSGSIPTWVVVLVLLVCAGGGLLLAFRLQKRKRER